MKRPYSFSCLFVILIFALTPLSRATTLSEGVSAWQQGRFSEAMSVLRPLANQGNPEAQRIIGEMYFEGKGVGADKSTAIAWLKRAGEAGDKIAQYDLGYIFQTGSGVPHSEQSAQTWYIKSAMQGYVPAQVKLGDLLADRNKPEALRWYEMAGFAGNKYAAERASRVGAELEEVHNAKIARELREEKEHIQREDRRHKEALEEEERQARIERSMESNAAPPISPSSPFDGLDRINRITQETLRQINRKATSPVAVNKPEHRSANNYSSETNGTNVPRSSANEVRSPSASVISPRQDASAHAPRLQRIVRSWGVQAFGKDVDEACRNAKAKQGASGGMPMGFVRVVKSEPCDCDNAQRHINGATMPASCKLALEVEVEVEVEGGTAGRQSGPASNTAR